MSLRSVQKSGLVAESPNDSSKRTAPPPLNSSVRHQWDSMQFSKENQLSLRGMGVDPEEFSESIFDKFGDDAKTFNLIIESFKKSNIDAMTTDAFNKFCESIGSRERNISDALYDLFNYLRLYKEGGRFALYKGRQAEWSGPKVTLQKSDIQSLHTELLVENCKIYRGMSRAEFNSNKFGQSWTTDIDVAKRFACETYSDEPPGIVAATCLRRSNVVYYDKDDTECEVIVVDGSVTSASQADA
jgi:hypothetical protein